MLFRAVVFLVMLFVVLYVGMTNTHRIDFYFPVMQEQKISQPAALIFFGVFAIGVVAGMMLNSGGGEKGGDGEGKKKR